MTVPLALLDSLIDTFQTDQHSSDVTVTCISKPAIDLTIFNNQDNHCNHAELNVNTNINDLCASLQRIITCQQYYEMTQNDSDNVEMLTQFIMEIYCVNVIINDYEHLMHHHKHDIYPINQIILNQASTIKCVLSTCGCTTRHYTRNQEGDDTINDANLSFFCGLFDSVHFYLNHSFECSLRMIPRKFRNNDNDNLSEFIALTNEIQKSRAKTDKFDRFSTSNEKFNIAINQPTQKGICS